MVLEVPEVPSLLWDRARQKVPALRKVPARLWDLWDPSLPSLQSLRLVLVVLPVLWVL